MDVFFTVLRDFYGVNNERSHKLIERRGCIEYFATASNRKLVGRLLSIKTLMRPLESMSRLPTEAFSRRHS